MTFTKKVLNADEYGFCARMLSHDAFAAITIHHLASRLPMTCVRASDGERALIGHGLYNAELAPFLKDDDWLTRYGVKGADLKALGKAIHAAGNNATFLAPTVSGLWLPQFKTWNLFTPRAQYVDIFYPYNWARNLEALHGVLNAAGKVLLAHKNCAGIISGITKSPKLTTKLVGFPLTSWSQHDDVAKVVGEERPDLVLICGGPHGKVLVDKLGQLTDQPRVILDVGSAVENAW